MSEWKKYPMGDLAKYVSKKIDISEATIDNYISTVNMLPEKKGVEKIDKLPKSKKIGYHEKEDILISNIRPYFKKIWFSNKIGTNSDDILVIRVLENGLLDKKYLYYYLFQNSFFDFMMTTSKGTKMPRGDKEAILRYEINVPAKKTQKKIAKILSDLDDKIEVNEKINKKLEEMAQAIFKHWFIDFEYPVTLDYECDTDEELKSELMRYGYKSFGGLPAPEKGKIFVYVLNKKDGSLITGTADFLLEEYNKLKKENPKIEKFIYWEKFNSDQEAKEKEEYLRTEDGKNWLKEELKTNPKSQKGKMKESKLGKIPEKWEIKEIKFFGKVICGKTPPKKERKYYDNAYIPFIKIPDMHNQIFAINTTDKLSNEAKKLINNKLLPTKSLCVSCIATVGKIVITNKESFTNQQINSIIPKKEYFLYYLYFYIKKMEKELNMLASGGSATLNLNTSQFSNLNIILSKENIIKKFYNIINNLFEDILNKQEENEKLSKIRDTLLPKLMSGELSVENLNIDIFEGGEEND